MPAAVTPNMGMRRAINKAFIHKTVRIRINIHTVCTKATARYKSAYHAQVILSKRCSLETFDLTCPSPSLLYSSSPRPKHQMHKPMSKTPAPSAHKKTLEATEVDER